MFSKMSEGGWNIAIRRGSAGLLLDNQSEPFKIIPNSWRSWAADPFVMEYNGTVYIFAELFDYLKRRGRIGYTYLKNGKWQPWKIVIDETFHMSYPNVFEYNGEIYMVPETSADRTLRLYKAVCFPDSWELERIIAQNVAFVDTTFFYQENELCAITTDISDHPIQRDVLLRFGADWKIVATEKIMEEKNEFSRCAGNILSCKHGKIRVSQNCDGHYGKALIFSNFREADVLKGLGKIVQQLSPQELAVNKKRNWTGLHTYNATQEYEVVDIERNHYTPVGLWGRLLSKTKQMVVKR